MKAYIFGDKVIINSLGRELYEFVDQLMTFFWHRAKVFLNLTPVSVLSQKKSASAVSSDGLSPLLIDWKPSRSKQMPDNRSESAEPRRQF